MVVREGAALSRIFISHSSRDNAVAVAVKQWLTEQDPSMANEVFLDIDSRTGIATGQQWKDALRAASTRCEVVLCLVSQHWLDSRECQVEYRTAEMLGKRIFVARLERVDGNDITRSWQGADLFGSGPARTFQPAGAAAPISLQTAGLDKLLKGLARAGIGADHFHWPPAGHPDRGPYRGWQPFDPADAAVFFGRDSQLLHGLDRLRRMRIADTRGLFVVLGPSGTGKSSFLRAGLIPRLLRDDREFVVLDIVRPQRQALSGAHGLAAAVHTTRTRFGLRDPALGVIKEALIAGDGEALQNWLAEIRSRAAAQQLADETASPPMVLVPIDQAEELFTADAGSEGSVLLDLISRVLTTRTPDHVPVVIAATIRTDRYEALQSAPQLSDVHTELFDELKPMPRHRFRDIITGPAERASAAGRPLQFDERLVDQLLDDCREGGDALPLLALILAALYRDYGSVGVLTLDHYARLGGIARVVAIEVDQVLGTDRGLREHRLMLLRSAFVPWLATVAPDSDQPLRRIARYEDLPVAARPLIDQFVERRLLVKAHNGTDITIEVALESLLRQWDDLAGWLREQADDLRTADNLERAAAEWEHHQRSDAWLLTGTRLKDAETLTAHSGYRARLAEVGHFIAISRTRENQRTESELSIARSHAAALRVRARALAAIIVVAVLAAVFAGAGFFLQSRASARADDRARETIATRLTSEAKEMLNGQRPEGAYRGMHEALAAYAIAPGPITRHELLDYQYQLRSVTRMRSFDFAADLAGLSTDGSVAAIVGFDNSQETVSIDRAGAAGQVAVLSRPVEAMAVSADGSATAVGDDVGTVRIFRSGQPERSLTMSHAINRLALSANGSTIIAVDSTGMVLISRPDVADQMVQSGGEQLRVGVSADGSTTAVSDSNGMALTIRRAGTPDQTWPLTERISDVALSADGSTVVAGGLKGTLFVVRHATPPEAVPVGSSPVAVAVSADGSTVAGGDQYGSVHLEQGVGDSALEHSLSMPDQSQILALSADGTTLAVGDVSGSVLIDHRGAPRQSLHLSQIITALTVSADGGTVTAVDAGGGVMTARTDDPMQILPGYDYPVVSGDGSTTAGVEDDDDGRTVSVIRRGTVEEPLHLPERVRATAVSADGSTVAAGDDQGTVAISRSGGPEQTFQLDQAVYELALSRDGTTIVAGDNAGAVRIIRAGGPDRTVRLGAKIMRVAVSADGSTVLAGDITGTVLVSRTGATDQIGHRQGEVVDLAVSADGSVAAVSDTTGSVSVTRGGNPPQTLHLAEGNSWMVMSSDGSTVVASDSIGTVMISRAGEPIRLDRLPHKVSSMAVSSNGSTIVVAVRDVRLTTVWCWCGGDGSAIATLVDGALADGLIIDEQGRRFGLIIDDEIGWVPILNPDSAVLCGKVDADMSDIQRQQWIPSPYQRIHECH